MKYISTRGWEGKATFSEAVRTGIAPDGGLFTPEGKVRTVGAADMAAMSSMDYRQRASVILSRFIDEYSPDDLADCIRYAYGRGNFDTDEIAPLFRLNEYISVLELWHGPTSAFKDLALQIMPQFMTKAVKYTNDSSGILILVATSGDTGKAALEGFKNVEGVKILVFYPDGGISEVQRMQMVTQEGSNVEAVAVKGNFDDAQNGVKEIFADAGMREKLARAGYGFSSANSINWGRLVPQTVYYFSAYADLLKRKE
ncbi:MAG: threonine synthase, partial [Eubacteriales bacterium]|nr:threonine synthase [Eubacteriales bacterium]